MLFALTAAALLIPTQESAAASQTSIHPDSAALFVSVPDFQAIIDFYPTTPSGQLVADEELHTAIGQVMGQGPLSPVDFVMGQYMQMVESGQMPALLDIGKGLESASMSVFLTDGGFYEYFEKQQSFLEGGYSDESWARREEYERDGMALRVVADFVDAESCALAAVALEGLFSEEAPWDMTLEPIGITPSGGAHLGAGEATLWRYQPTGENANEGSLDASLSIIAGGSRLALSLGNVDPIEFMEELSAAESIAKSNTAMTTKRGLLGKAAGVPVLEMHLVPFIEQLILDEEPMLLPLIDIAEGLLGPVASAIARGGYWRVNYDAAASQFVTEGVHAKSKRSPLSGLIGHAPLDENARTLALPGSLVATVSTFDKTVLRKLVEDLEASEQPGALDELEEEFDFRLETDLIDTLGDSFGYSLNKISSLVAPPNLMFAVELDDAEGFTRGMDGVFRMINSFDDEDIQIARKTYKKTSTLYEMSVPGLLGDFANIPGVPIDLNNFIRPTIAVVGDRAILTLTPGYAKKEVRRSLKRGYEGAEIEIHAGIEGLGKVDGVTTLGYANWAEFVGGLYTQAKALAPLLAAGGALPFDPSELPKADLLTKYFKPSERRVRLSGDMVVHEARSSFGPELGVVLPLGLTVGTSAVVARQGAVAMEADEMIIEAELVPAPADAVESVTPVIQAADTRSVTTEATLAEIRVAITLYQLDNDGKSPTSLSVLLEPTDTYKDGYLEGDLPKDGWDHEFVYSDTTDAYTLYSVGANGTDEKGEGDDIKAD